MTEIASPAPPPPPVIVPTPVPPAAITTVAVPVSPNLPELNPDASGGQGTPPQGQPAGSPPPSTGMPAPAAEAVTLSPSLQKLLSANLTNAVAIGRDPLNRVIIRTDMGSFVAPDNNALQPNARLQLQFNPAEPQKTSVIFVDEQPLPTPLRLQLAPAPPGADPGARLPGGQTATAIVAAGVPLVVGRAPETMLPTGSQLVLRIQTSPTAALDPSLSRQVTGTVLGQNEAGQLLLRTPLGTLAVNARLSVPMNAPVNFQVVDLRPPPAMLPADEATALVQRLGRTWPAMEEAITVLQAAEPEVAQRFIATHMPQLNPGLARAAIAFLAGLRSGKAPDWLGNEVVKTLEHAGRADLVKTLADDFEQLANGVQQPGNGDWRTFIFPLYTGQMIKQVQFYVRRHKKRDKDGREQDAGSRFVVELDLDATGAMQFDGLVQDKRFDLIMRSERALAAQWRADINLIFTDAMAITGMTGSIAFQAGRPGTVQPSQDLQRTHAAAVPAVHLSNIVA